jgi:methylenetetrahydrofolate reductase (NADPH)
MDQPHKRIGALIRGFSIEVTPGGVGPSGSAIQLLPIGMETFIAYLPTSTPDQLLAAAETLQCAHMTPVPHIVAQSFASEADLDRLLQQLNVRAGVTRVLVIAGDRDAAVGPYESALQIIRTGLLEKNGIRSVYVSCYPEGHPRISDEQLETARIDKLAAIEQAGLAGGLVSQFCFEPAPIIALARRMGDSAHPVPYRVGLAGPASTATLMKYAMMCGVGSSMRALRERQSLTRNLLSGATPEHLIEQLARAKQDDPAISLDGVHFFTFGALAKTVELAASMTKRAA